MASQLKMRVEARINKKWGRGEREASFSGWRENWRENTEEPKKACVAGDQVSWSMSEVRQGSE